jgi:hypothetical protein
MVNGQKVESEGKEHILNIEDIHKIETKIQDKSILSEVITDEENCSDYLTLQDLLNMDISLINAEKSIILTLKEILKEREQRLIRGLSTNEIDEKISNFLRKNNIKKLK